MRCFNHPEVFAHGTCKVCGRGICSHCSTDLGHSIACKDSHEQLAQDLHSLALRSITVQKTAKRSIYIAPAFFGFMGLVFLVAGIRDSSSNASFPTLLGAGFIVFAIVVLFLNIRAYGRDKNAA
jgi:hypothetical protein